MRKGTRMIVISIEGGTAKQRDLGENALRYYVKKLLPRKRSLNIDLRIKNLLKDDIAGLCEHVGGNEFVIDSHHRGNLYEFLSYLAHESIHLKQFATGQLKYVRHKELWEGEDFTNVPYKQQPWEVEAWDGQHELAKDFIKNEMGLTLKAAKELSPRTLNQMNWKSEVLFLDKLCAAQAKRKRNDV